MDMRSVLYGMSDEFNHENDDPTGRPEGGERLFSGSDPFESHLDNPIAQNSGTLYRAQRLLSALGAEEIKDASDKLLGSVMAQIREESVATVSTNAKSTSKSRWFQYIAASVVVAIVGIGGYIASGRTDVERYSEVLSTYREYATKPGQRATFNLPDGTQVVLNVGSQIRVPDDFNTDQRLVYLEGEAQFTVSHDAAKPFVVSAQGNLIKDLATVFSIKAYPGDGRTTVYVAAGAVAVKSQVSSSTPSVLHAGDLAVVTAGHEMLVERDVNPGRYMGWVYGTLSFENTSLSSVLLDLSRWFDLSFVIVDSDLKERRVTTRINEKSTSDEVIADLADILDAEVSRAGKTVTFATRKNTSPQ